MGGLGPISLPPLPSPAAGIGMPNVFAQLAQAAGQFPQQKQAAEENRLKLETQQRKVAQDQYDRITQMVKGNRALAGSPVIIKQLKDLSKTLGIPAPIVSGSDTAMSSPSAGGQGAPATASGAPQPPANSAAPGAPGAWHPPMAVPPGGVPQPGIAPAAQQAQQQPARAPQMTAQTGGEMVDTRALFPRQSYQEFAVDPRNVAEAMKLSPAQRRATYGHMDDAPESFFIAPKSWGPEDRAKSDYARSLMNDAFKSGDKNAVLAAVRMAMPMFADNPDFDPSTLIDPAAFATIGQNEARKLSILEKAGVLKGVEAQQRWKKIDADIRMMGTREGLMRATTALTQERTKYVGPEAQARIENAHARATTAAGQLNLGIARLGESIRSHNIAQLGKDRGEVARYRTSLVSEVGQLRNEARGALQSGDEALASQLADQITGLQDQIEQADKTIRESHSGGIVQGAMQKAIPGAGAVKPKPGSLVPDPGIAPMQFKGRTIIQVGGKWVFKDDGTPAQ